MRPISATCVACAIATYVVRSSESKSSQDDLFGIGEEIIFIKVCQHHACIVLLNHFADKAYCFLCIGVIKVAERLIHKKPGEGLEQGADNSDPLLFAV